MPTEYHARKPIDDERRYAMAPPLPYFSGISQESVKTECVVLRFDEGEHLAPIVDLVGPERQPREAIMSRDEREERQGESG